jgi:alanyl-tRNA synthetase
VKKQLAALTPMMAGGVDVVGGVFPPVDRSILSEAAELYKNSGKVCVLVSAGESVSVIVSSGTPKADCKEILSKVLPTYGGRGGGKPDFAQGGIADPALSEEVFSKMMTEVVQRLQLIK